MPCQRLCVCGKMLLTFGNRGEKTFLKPGGESRFKMRTPLFVWARPTCFSAKVSRRETPLATAGVPAGRCREAGVRPEICKGPVKGAGWQPTFTPTLFAAGRLPGRTGAVGGPRRVSAEFLFTSKYRGLRGNRVDGRRAGMAPALQAGVSSDVHGVKPLTRPILVTCLGDVI